MPDNVAVQHDTTARPTLRLLGALTEGWTDTYQARAIKEHRWADIQPLSHLSHPLLEKCHTVLGTDGEATQAIACSGDLRLAEVRTSQWRGGVWTDHTDGTQWIVAAGLAKGGHRDREDFYEVLGRQCGTAAGKQALLPTEEDRLLLKRETAARVMADWELKVQAITAELLSELSQRIDPSQRHRSRTTIPHPIKEEGIAEIEIIIEVVDGIEEIVLTFLSRSRPGSHLDTVLVQRLLTSIAPPQQDWDTVYGTYSAMEAPGHCAQQAEVLKEALAQRRLLESIPGQVAHHAHRRDIGVAAVNGTAVRSLCGTWFVPRTDPDRLPRCEECESRYSGLPQ